MSLTDFLADQSTGSWADEMEDLPSAPAAAFSDHEKGGFGDRRSGFSERRTYSRDSRYESRDSPRDSKFPSRTPQPLPTSPPYTVHLGNLPYDLSLTEEDVKKFFCESKINTVRILRDKDDKPKGFGYVEFEDLESLTKALQLSGENLGKRPVRISVAEPREREDRTAGEWRRIMPRESPASSPRSDRFGSSDKFGSRDDKWGDRGGGFRDRGERSDRGERDRGDRAERSVERNDRGGIERKVDTEWRGGAFSNKPGGFRERRSEERFNSVRKHDIRPLPESKAEHTSTVATDIPTSPPPMRKKLELKPRSSSTVVSNEAVSPPKTSKPNPFGDAKPIDSDEALRRSKNGNDNLTTENVFAEKDSELRVKTASSNAVASFVIFGSLFALGVIIICACINRRLKVDKNRIPDVNDPEIARAEASLVETLNEAARQNYERARSYPPDSIPTDITLSQFLSIQEKGVSAWEFEPDLQHSSCFVECRTEIAFYDGECCVQTNLPLPKQQEVYYWEAKMYDKPQNTTVTVGLATKPYPLFRLPGWNRQSVAYFSDSGFKYYNSPFNGKTYGPQFQQGDVVGVGYRPRTGTVFFTRNGKKLDDAFTGMKMNLFPTVGANGPCSVHVNFGQLGFVFIEANVKKWGLAPTMGTLAPPPAYGSERGSILLESSSRGRPSEDVARLQYSNVNSGIMTGVPPEAGLDISLSDITVPPPSYSSVDRYYERQSFMSESSETYLLAGEQSDSRRNSYESTSRDQQRRG
ncbi:15790_t:CDS:10 [Funneliformis geosporum]|uniref:15790_t:CDS:1 n=1 Tax=Funneliformis geosporum TaxID=1117311 RepID=A0A9W4SU00_9GLOM|nr:15790_t:CDS:10 [Funneliformis geosporum]